MPLPPAALSLADLYIAEQHLIGMVDECLRSQGEACESVIELSDGVEYFCTAAIQNGQVEACIGPRDYAEKMLSPHGLTTHQFFD